MRELLPATIVSFLLHLMVVSVFTLSFTGRAGPPQRGPIWVRILEPSGVSRAVPSSKADTRTRHKGQVKVPQKPQDTEVLPVPPAGGKGLSSEPALRKPLSKAENLSGKTAEGKKMPSGPEPSPGESSSSKGGGTSSKMPLSEDLTIRELLPGDLIARAARRPVEKEAEKPSHNSITFSTKELKYEPYLMRLKERIETIWVYPPEAIERGIYGDLIIEFGIKKDGSLAYARVVRTSGFEILDEAALKALKDGQPYWPLPESWKEDILSIRGHFIYTLGGMYIR